MEIENKDVNTFPQEQVPQEQIIQEQTPQEQIIQEQTTQEQIIQEQTPQEQIIQEQTPQEQIIQEQTPQEQKIQEQTPQEQIIQEQTPQEQIIQEQTPQEQIIQEQTPQEQCEKENGGNSCKNNVTECASDHFSNENSEELNLQDNVDSAVKIVVFGKDGTGKSALIVRLLTRRFIHEYDPTSENVYGHKCVIDGCSVLLKIMDTAGMVERNIHEREEQIKWGDGYLLVMSLTNSESLKELGIIKGLIDEFSERQKPIVLVANKSDLVHAREVSPSDVTQVAQEMNCTAFETAATGDYDLVSEPFFCLYREIQKCDQDNDFPKLKTAIDSGLVLREIS